MPPKKTSSTKKCANLRMETPVVDFMMHTHSGAPINQRMLQTKTSLPPAKKIKPAPLPRGNSFMNFDDYSTILARRAKSSVATTEPRTDTESDTQDHPKTDDPVTDNEDNSEGQADAHKGNPVDDTKIRESLPPSDTPEDEGSSLNGTPSSENNYPYRNRQARSRAECHAMLAQRDHSSSEEESDEDDDEYKEDQEADEEKEEEEEDDDDNNLPAPPSKAKLPKKRAPPKALSPKSTVTETSLTTQVLQAATHVTTKSVEKSAVSSALPKSSMSMEIDDDDNDLPITSRPGQLCQEGIDDVQELGRKTLHAAKIIGDKYGKSAHTILIEARLSVKHSRAETPWNMHQGWYKGQYPRETDEELVNWRKRQRDHYYSLEDSDPLWDDIQMYYDCHLGGASNNRSRASIIMSTRDALAKRFAAYSHLEGIEVIGCVFDSTPDEAAQQALGFVAGSSTFMDLINERQVDAQLALDWIITAAKAKNYQLAMLRFGGAYDILFSKPGEAPWDCYRRIWPVMVLEKLEQFGYKTKSVQWRKLLDVAYQNKFQFELWPDEVPPVGLDFNYHTLSAQHLKLLVVPYIKHRASQYYDAELKTEAENLLELRRKQGHSDKTLDDIIDELDVAVSEIDIVPWLKDHIEQCEKDDPKMFDIPLVTSASHIVLRKLTDSEKFKHSIPKGLLQKYKEATSIRGSNVGAPSGGRQLGDTTRDRRSQQQTSAAREYSIVHEDHYTDDGRSQRSYVIVMVHRILNCHLRTLSLLILDLDFSPDLALVHLHLTTNHINTGMMRPFESGCKGTSEIRLWQEHSSSWVWFI
ncbi:uncharacterized protein F5147DRAFT_647429 [Suillus discolor]|uniref:Uncharacterized protein n=1 Tax=Suillus discolor TaxID=1912936 RepID=A0A9P7FJT9_9AGAM|nr:uncharacterized protein F5147DRAFT_647429 [Suillus discolor]KAG2119472.1 hypothetical protein F5147DRAFT_647429 [Suillus discolor]